MKTRFFIILIGLLLTTFGVVAQEIAAKEFHIEFRQGSADIDPDFSNNYVELAKLRYFLKYQAMLGHKVIDFEIVSLDLAGGASLEDSFERNTGLATARIDTLRNFIYSIKPFDDTVVVRNDSYIPWEELRNYVSTSSLPDKRGILAIIDQEEDLAPYHGGPDTIDRRILQLKEHNSGRTWSTLFADFFPKMRFATAVIAITAYKPADDEPPIVEAAEEIIMPFEQFDTVPATAPVVNPAPAPLRFAHHLYFKSNALGWAMGMTNAGVEVDIAPHWSFSFMAYYSGWNYFTERLKFRLLSFRPEFRYWFHPSNERWFVGIHGASALYNFAFHGRYRYQDHRGHTPALGAGIDAGYRMPLTANRRWHVEFGISAGAYRLHYDKFINEHNGRKVGDGRRTYIGIDAASVTFSYRIGLDPKRKEGAE